MFDFNNPNFDLDGDGIPDIEVEGVDLDGDGIPDQYVMDVDGDGTPDAVFVDMDGDGIPDQVALDTDGDGYFDTTLVDTDGDGSFDALLMDTDGDGEIDTVGQDTNNDGVIDTYRAQFDTDGDGIVDKIVESNDYDQNGSIDSETVYRDYDNDGQVDEVIKGYDSDGDGVVDTFTTYRDYDGDGREDEIFREQRLDTDGDGQIDTVVVSYDADGDRAFEAVEVYNVDAVSGELALQQIDPGQLGNIAGMRADELVNFDPDKADMDAVTGDPAESMKGWEFQGDTGRCALYSQKFVIEELTDQRLDIEELAALAEEKGWFSEDTGTPLLNMDKVLDHFGIHNEMSFHNSLDDIEKCLGEGGKVIVSIDADEIWYGQNDSLFTPGNAPNHAVEVIGIDRTNPDEPMVILNDSGNPDGCGEMVPADVFVDAWEDGNCQMIACM